MLRYVTLLVAAPFILAVNACGAVNVGSDESESVADVAGVSVLPQGPCPRADAGAASDAATASDAVSEGGGHQGAACGSRGLPECATGVYCIYPQSAGCGATDRPGICRDMRVVRCGNAGPAVCGCDGTTYNNECIANIAGVSVRSYAPCP